MKSCYVDTAAITNVIGCVFNNSSILDETDKYVIKEDDFVEDFHKVLYGSIYNIHLAGSKVTVDAIIDYLANRPKYEAIFKQNKGEEYLEEASSLATQDTFNYYYHRLKKFTLLRAFDEMGFNVAEIYDPKNLIDTKKRQQQEDWLDSASLSDIVKQVDNKIENIKSKYVEEDNELGCQAGQGLRELLEKLKATPDVGAPMYGQLINTVTKGARLRKYYLRSAPTGHGKSRTMVADACNFACNTIYHESFGWIRNGASQPTLYIATEQSPDEIQTMMVAFLANVNEEHVITGRYLEGEAERVDKAIEVIESSPLWIEWLPDFSLKDVENKIKKYIREHGVLYVIFDYIKTSPKILQEISQRSGGVKLREDNVLFMLSSRLKDMANEYGIFVMSGTQLNESWKSDDIPDQNLLRGAKSIADLCDLGMILLKATPEDLVKLEPVLGSNPNFQTPNMKLSIYKNRRGRYTGCYLWCVADLGTCRVEPQFCTDWQHGLMPIEQTSIIIEDEDTAAWNVKKR